MIKYLKHRILIILILSITLGAENKKLAQTGFQFLSISTNARGGGMADALTTIHSGSASLFFNPAGLSRQREIFDINFSSNNWIADIQHQSISLSFNPKNGKYGVFGFTFHNVDYGEIQGTMVWDNEQGFIDTEVFRPTAIAMGAGYGMALSENFSVGGQIKKAYQNLGRSVVPKSDTSHVVQKNIADALAFDFGTIYRTDWHGFTFGMSVRNFSDESQFAYDGFQLPLTFRIGGSIDVLSFTSLGNSSHGMLMAFDALHPRSYPERINVGIEYSFRKMFMARTGYLYNYDERGITFGFGAKIGPIIIDYAHTPFGIFDAVSRISIGITR